jgi:hypothetical protein
MRNGVESNPRHADGPTFRQLTLVATDRDRGLLAVISRRLLRAPVGVAGLVDLEGSVLLGIDLPVFVGVDDRE